MPNVRQRIYHNITSDIKGVVASTKRSSIREIEGQNTAAVDIYLQIFDLAAVPADGVATPMIIAPIKVPAGSRFDLVFDRDLHPDGLIATTGIYVCASSTKYTKTLVLANSIDLTVIYESN